MLRTFFSVLLLALTMLPGVFGQVSDSDSVASQLLRQLGNQDTDTGQMKIYWDLTQHFFYSDASLSREYASQSYLLAKQSGTVAEQCNSLRLVGSTLVNEGHYLPAVDTLYLALLLSPVVDANQIEIHTSLGITYQHLYDYEAALYHYQESIRLSEELDKPRLGVPAWRYLASLYTQRGEYAPALSKAKEARIRADRFQWPEMQAYIDKDLAFIFMQLGQLDSAMTSVQRAIELTEKANDFPYIASDVYVKLSLIYAAQAYYEAAIQAAEKARSLALSTHAKPVLIRAEIALAAAWRELHAYDLAKVHAHEALAIARETKWVDEEIASMELLVDLHRRTGDYQQAFEYQNKVVALRDTHFQQERILLRSLTSKQGERAHQQAHQFELEAQIKNDAELIRKNKAFGISMALFFLLIVAAMYLMYRAKPLHYGNAFAPIHFTDEEKKLRISFIRRASLFFLVLTIPLLGHYIVWGPPALIAVHLFFSMLLISAHLLARRGKIDATIYGTILTSYPIIAAIPIWTGPLNAVVITHIAVFLAINYVSQHNLQRVLNVLFLLLAFFADYYIAHHAITPVIGNHAGLEFMLGIISIAIIVLSMVNINISTNRFKYALYKSNRFLSEIADLNPHFIFAKDREGRFSFVNAAMENAYGLKKGEMIGKTDADIRPGFEWNQQFLADDKEVMNAGVAIHRKEEKMIDQYAQEKWVETYKQPLLNAAGAIVGLLGVSVDHTARKFAEEEQRKSEKKYRDIFEHGHQGILIYDYEDQELVDCNSRALEIYGCQSLGEMKSLKLIEWLAPVQLSGETAEAWYKRHETMLVESGTIHYTMLARKLNGEQFVASETAIKDFAGDGKHIGFFLSDITENYRTQQEVLERKMIYEALIEHAFDGIDICEIKDTWNPAQPFESRLVVRNEVLEKMLHRVGEDTFMNMDLLLNQRGHTLLPNKDSRLARTPYLNEIGEKHSMEFDRKITLPNNEYVEFSVVLHLIRVGKKQLLIRFVRDITLERYQQAVIQQQLKDLNQKNIQLQKYIESNLNLENFAYLASHDLKSPIRTIVSFTQLLERKLKGRLSQDEKEYLKFIVSASQNMQKLINDLLAYSRVNTTKLHVIPIHVNSLLQQVCVDLRAEIKEKSAIVKWEEMPSDFAGDEIKLRQLFQNLIGNALKFTPADRKPQVVIRGVGRDTEWEFSIQDNGIGIDEEYLENIFLLFRRLHSDMEYEGTGIGLALCKKVVEQHDGEIWVESTLGVGTTFFFRIPRKQITGGANGRPMVQKQTNQIVRTTSGERLTPTNGISTFTGDNGHITLSAEPETDTPA